MAKTHREEWLTPIEASCLYPLAVFQKHAGLSQAALRTARRRGLRVLRTGGRAFILGSDFIEYVIQVQGEDDAER